jgi:transcription-repair coupling factor (superfamily II helicase)
MQLLFPDAYVESITERVRLYRRLDTMRNEEELARFQSELIDRFGPLPEQSKQLLSVVRLRWKAIDLGFEKVILKNSKMIVHFISDQHSPYYQSQRFADILQFVQKNQGCVQMKEGKKLSMAIASVKTIDDALQILRSVDNQ